MMPTPTIPPPGLATLSLPASRQSGGRLSIRPIAASLFFFLLLAPLAHGAEDWKAEKKAIEKTIQQQSISIHQLEQGLKKQEQQAQETIAREKELLAELDLLDAALLKHGARLLELEESMAAQRELIATREGEIDTIRSKRQKIQAHTQERINAYYRTGTIGMINVAFSARSLPELLSIHDAFSILLQYDRDLLRRYRESLAELERSTRALTLEKDLLATFIDQVRREKEELEKTSREKIELLERIRTQTRLHELAARELERATSDLAAQLSGLRQKKERYSQGFLLNQGRLPTPVQGKVLTLYGQPDTNKLGEERICKGIVLDAPHGTRVRAIFEGTVNYAGYLHGYGNTLVIDHGFGYSTVLARMETLLKKEGDTVKTGEQIGIMGETASLIEEGLYLEIRHNDETEDPLLWLDKKNLSLP